MDKIKFSISGHMPKELIGTGEEKRRKAVALKALRESMNNRGYNGVPVFTKHKVDDGGYRFFYKICFPIKEVVLNG